MATPHPTPTDAERDRIAARVLRSYLDGRHLPPFLPGEPASMAALVTAANIAPDILDALADIYGVDRWDLATFERVVLDRAFRAWHQDLDLHREPGAIVSIAGDCPVLPQARKDPRVCLTCQAVQSHMAALSTAGRIHETRFREAIALGGHSCQVRLSIGPEGGAAR